MSVEHLTAQEHGNCNLCAGLEAENARLQARVEEAELACGVGMKTIDIIAAERDHYKAQRDHAERLVASLEEKLGQAEAQSERRRGGDMSRCPGSDEPLMKDGRCTHCGRQFSVRSNGKLITLGHEYDEEKK